MERLDITICGREYSLVCAPNERDNLVSAARYVNKKMLALKQPGKAMSTERLAVMAALQIAVELLSMPSPDLTSPTDGEQNNLYQGTTIGEIKRKIDILQHAVELAIAGGEGKDTPYI